MSRTSRFRRPLMGLASASVLATTGLLAGCGVLDFSVSVPISAVETLAENALQEHFGATPDIDCGDGDVQLSENMTFDCTVTDPNTGVEAGAVVKIGRVDGTDFSVDVELGGTEQK